MHICLTSEVRAARLEGMRVMRQHVQTVCGDETSEGRADGCYSEGSPPDVYITLVII